MRPASERRPYNVKNCKIAYVTITVLLFRTATLRMGWGGSCFNNICTHRFFQNQRNENQRHKLLRNRSILKIVNIQNGNVVNWITFYIYQFCIVLAFNANKSRDYLRIHVYMVARAFLWPLIFISLLLYCNIDQHAWQAVHTGNEAVYYVRGRCRPLWRPIFSS